jgi:hypothetical protein
MSGIDIGNLLTAFANSRGPTKPDFDFEPEDEPGRPETNVKIVRAILATNNMTAATQVPQEYWCESLVETILQMAASCLVFVPEQYFTRERCMAMLKKTPHVWFTHSERIREDCKTPETALMVLKNLGHKARRIIEVIPESQRTAAFWHAAVDACWKAFRYIPAEYQTWDLIIRTLVCHDKDDRCVSNLARRFKGKSLRKAINMEQKDPIGVDWEEQAALCPDGLPVTLQDLQKPLGGSEVGPQASTGTGAAGGGGTFSSSGIRSALDDVLQTL